MANYSATFQKAIAANTTLGYLINPGSGSPRRGKVYSVVIGSEGSPADTGILLQAGRITAAGTPGTAVTPQPLDPADTAALASGMAAPATEPTYPGNTLLSISWNQRSTIVWTARPGKELVYPNSTNNGIGFKTPVINTTGPATTMTVFFEEQ